MKNPDLLQWVRGGKMKKALFAVFLVGIGIAAAQTPPDQKEAMRRAARSARVKIIGWPTLTPAELRIAALVIREIRRPHKRL